MVTDDRRAVLVGTALWVLALLACLVARDALAAAGHGWWTGVCVAGVVIGAAGLGLLQRRHVARSTGDRLGRTGDR